MLFKATSIYEILNFKFGLKLLLKRFCHISKKGGDITITSDNDAYYAACYYWAKTHIRYLNIDPNQRISLLSTESSQGKIVRDGSDDMTRNSKLTQIKESSYNISDVCRKYLCLYNNTNVELIDVNIKNERRRNIL